MQERQASSMANKRISTMDMHLKKIKEEDENVGGSMYSANESLEFDKEGGNKSEAVNASPQDKTSDQSPGTRSSEEEHLVNEEYERNQFGKVKLDNNDEDMLLQSAEASNLVLMEDYFSYALFAFYLFDEDEEIVVKGDTRVTEAQQQLIDYEKSIEDIMNEKLKDSKNLFDTQDPASHLSINTSKSDVKKEKSGSNSSKEQRSKMN